MRRLKITISSITTLQVVVYASTKPHIRIKIIWLVILKFQLITTLQVVVYSSTKSDTFIQIFLLGL